MTKGGNGKTVEENNALMANGANGRSKPPEKRTFWDFIWNKRDGTFLGRTAKSWAQIIVFYIIFYICLAAFWMACLAIFLSTIDKSVPRYYGEDTIIGANPGVGYQPWLKEEPESTLIKFDKANPKSYSKYLDAIDAFMEKYENTNNTRECNETDGNYKYVEKTTGKTTRPDSACRFNLDILEKNGCGKKTDYGFRDGKPCIILSLNRLINWIPEDFSESEVPDKIRSRYKPGSVAFNCEGSSDRDKEVLGYVRHIPSEGISSKFYPYAVMDNYHQPFAVVKFMRLPLNAVVMVECAAYARNIEQDEESRSGMVTFELQLKDTW